MYANLFVPLPYLEVPYNCVDGVETKQMICDSNCLARKVGIPKLEEEKKILSAVHN